MWQNVEELEQQGQRASAVHGVWQERISHQAEVIADHLRRVEKEQACQTQRVSLDFSIVDRDEIS